MHKTLCQKLYAIGAVKFGEFTLKRGMLSPIYIDLRVIISYPALLKEVASQMHEKTKPLRFDCVCGVPYTALPIATALSLAHDIPMCMRRKEVKTYGTKKAIEGVFAKGDRCLLIEDLITSGASCFETIEPLKSMGLEVKDVVVLLDREQGGKRHLESKGLCLQAVLTLSDLLNTLHEANQIERETLSRVQNFISLNQVTS